MSSLETPAEDAREHYPERSRLDRARGAAGTIALELAALTAATVALAFVFVYGTGTAFGPPTVFLGAFFFSLPAYLGVRVVDVVSSKATALASDQ